MSKVESAGDSRRRARNICAWLQRERRGHLFVRATQLAILVVFLVLWEVLPRALSSIPLLTSYPSALWPTFLELLKATPQQASILTHTWATVLATVLGFTGAMVLGTAVAAALWWWDSALQGARSRISSSPTPCRRRRSCRSSTSGSAPRCRSTACRSRSRVFITILMIY